MITDTAQKTGKLTFLKYSFPVMGYCNKVPVSVEEISEFEDMLRFGGSPSIERLELLFPDAVKYLESWNEEDVRDYWLRMHNKIVSDNPLCKVYGGRIEEILPASGKEICRARIGCVMGLHKSYMPLQIGDLVSVHALQVAEKFSDEEFNMYFR